MSKTSGDKPPYAATNPLNGSMETTVVKPESAYSGSPIENFEVLPPAPEMLAAHQELFEQLSGENGQTLLTSRAKGVGIGVLGCAAGWAGAKGYEVISGNDVHIMSELLISFTVGSFTSIGGAIIALNRITA